MANPALVDPATIRATTAEAWIRGYPILQNYRTLYAQALDDADPGYVGGFGVFRHHPPPPSPAAAGTPTPTPGTPTPGMATAESDTAYSRAWLDLRTEPWVLSVPAMDRPYVLPLHELDTVYAGFVGTRTTGREAGDHLVAGPDWRGEAPPGVRGVIRTATRLVGILGRTCLADRSPADVADLKTAQQQYRLRPLHEYAGTPAPDPAPEPVWPVWRAEVLDTVEFLGFLDFLFGFFPLRGAVELPPAEIDLRGRLTDLGIDGRGEFEPATLPIEVRAEIERGIADGRARLERAAAGPGAPAGFWGTREQIGADFLSQALGARLGLYALPTEESRYGGSAADGTNGPDSGGTTGSADHTEPATTGRRTPR
ncbi:DUF1254 domain-containing protein [Kitasatospora sp. NPDC087314]|uniref:DUF1254 domain-containing protein n=1 Tax=Kitasatospora sp. NPDC087314 TaxID=3364068 RepID=UPI0038094AA2